MQRMSPDQQRALERMRAVTLNNNPHALSDKHRIVAEVNAYGHMPIALLRQYPSLYVGSHVDVCYGLLLGARKLIMLDPLFRDVSSLMTVIDIIEAITGEKVRTSVRDQALHFTFDFGEGDEEASVLCLGKKLVIDELTGTEGEVRTLDHRTSHRSQQNSSKAYASFEGVPEYVPDEPLAMALSFNAMGNLIGFNQAVLAAIVPGGIILTNDYGTDVLDVDIVTSLMIVTARETSPEGWSELMRVVYENDGRFTFVPLERQRRSMAYTFLEKRLAP